jgi:hypothetical protein
VGWDEIGITFAASSIGGNMATIWLTYAWADNQANDVDFIAQELQQAGLLVKLDRWNLGAGRRLWEQIATFITDPKESDAWVLVATQNSLASEPCREEFAYALGRALDVRGTGYPVIGLFPGHVDQALIPPAIKTRLFVSITDVDWKERIVAAAEGRQHVSSNQIATPYHLKIHNGQPGNRPFAIEVRPRAGVWSPFIAVIPASEKEMVDPHFMIGPRDVPTAGGSLVNTGSNLSPDGTNWIMGAGNQATPTESYYIWCKELPSALTFGVNGKDPQYTVKL